MYIAELKNARITSVWSMVVGLFFAGQCLGPSPLVVAAREGIIRIHLEVLGLLGMFRFGQAGVGRKSADGTIVGEPERGVPG